MIQRSDPADRRSDQDLIAACRQGEAAAWEQLIRRYQRLLYTVPLRLGLSEDESADVFQQTCLRLYERLDTIHDPAHLSSWLISTSRRLALDTLAHKIPRAHYGTPVPDQPDSAAGPDRQLEELEEQHRIRRAVALLDDRCRILLYNLFYNPDEPSYEQIAALLGMPKNSVGPIRARCFSRLVRLLEEQHI